jgi:acetyl esterase/lipase
MGGRHSHTLFCCLILTLPFFVGCVRLPGPNQARLPQPLPDSLSAQFTGTVSNSFQSHEKLIGLDRWYSRIQLTFTNCTTTSNITIDYYQLRGKSAPSPAIILLPISGGGYEIENHFARYFARHGFAVAIVHRIDVRSVAPRAAAIDEWLKKNIANQKQVLDWMQTRKEIDPGRIGVFGISMGGIQAALLAPLDPRIKTAIFGLAAGDIAFVLSHSSEKSIARQRTEFLRSHNMPLEEFQSALQKAITYDPNLLAPYLDPKQVMLVLGMWDTVVPFGKGWELREKLGRPETVLVPTGHYTALLALPYIKYRCLRFLRGHLKPSRTTNVASSQEHKD